MYAQKLEGDEWIGERMDVGKIDKMSGKRPPQSFVKVLLTLCRSTIRTYIIIHKVHSES